MRNTPRPEVVTRHHESSALLAAVGEHGAPLVEPDPGDPSTVIATWVWVDDPADPFDWVYLDANGITDRQWLRSGLLRRLPGSTVSALSLRVPARWRGTYALIPGRGRLARPRASAGDEAERRWWLGVLDRAVPDPFNDGPIVQPMRGGRCSEAAMPSAPPHPWWTARPAAVPAVTQQRVELHDGPRQVWTVEVGPATTTGGDVAADLAVLFDGQGWATTMPIASSLGALGEQLDRRLVVALVDSVDVPTRSRDLTCSAPFREAICDRLVPWLRATFGATDDPRRAVVAGQSYGGLASVDMVLERPDVFANALSQSGSFWWPAPFGGEPAWVWGDRLAERDRRDLRIWLEAGALEAEMDELTRRFTMEAAVHGSQVWHRSFCGGHDVVQWRDGLVEGLATLLDTTPDRPGARRWSLPAPFEIVNRWAASREEDAGAAEVLQADLDLGGEVVDGLR